jgi:hypothetical protein
LKKKKLKTEVLTAQIEPTSPGGGIPTGMVTFELLTKKKRKIKTKVLGSAAAIGGDASLTLKPRRVTVPHATGRYTGRGRSLLEKVGRAIWRCSASQASPGAPRSGHLCAARSIS